MIVTPWERRAAERFNDLLDTNAPSAHDEIAPLIALTKRMDSLTDGSTMDPAFRDRFRTRLLAVAAVQGVGDTSREREQETRPSLRRRRFTPRRTALISGTIATLIALSGVGVASNGAMPGDALYSIKRSREAAQLALARSDVSRGQLHLDFARTRLKEARQVDGNVHELGQALDDMDAETRSGMLELSDAAVERRSAAPLDAVDSFVKSQRGNLANLVAELPTDKRRRALDSLMVIEQVRQRSSSLRPDLLCTADYSGAGDSDELGPIPRSCTTASRGRPGGEKVPNPGGPSLSSSPSNGHPSPVKPGAPTPTDSASQSQGDTPSHSTSPSEGLALTNPSNDGSPSPAPSSSDGNMLTNLGGILGSLLGPGSNG